MTRYLLESRKITFADANGTMAFGWELTFYNDVIGKVEKTRAVEDDTILQAEPEATAEAAQQEVHQDVV